MTYCKDCCNYHKKQETMLDVGVKYAECGILGLNTFGETRAEHCRCFNIPVEDIIRVFKGKD